jgi:hypothetical protein
MHRAPRGSERGSRAWAASGAPTPAAKVHHLPHPRRNAPTSSPLGGASPRRSRPARVVAVGVVALALVLLTRRG